MQAARSIAALIALSPIVAWATNGSDSSIHLPEPETLALLGVGLVALLITRYFRRK